MPCTSRDGFHYVPLNCHLHSSAVRPPPTGILPAVVMQGAISNPIIGGTEAAMVFFSAAVQPNARVPK